MKIDSMEELLVEELKDLYDAEKQLVRALPKFAKAASDEELGAAFRHHLDQTKAQVQRLEQVFDLLGAKAKSKPCKGMKGLVEEGSEVLHEDASEALADSAIIGAAKKVEHYEMAGYDSARMLAQAIGNKDAAQLLQETLKEEDEADRKLTQIAKRLMKEANGGSAAEEKGAGKRAAGVRKMAATSRGNGRKSSQTKQGGEHTSKMTTDHEEIRRWAEERGAQPACVKDTYGRKGDTCVLRLDFPGYTGEETLEHISWDEFFRIFDEQGLALVYQEHTADGKKSNFNKLVSRERAA
jgi:ferritin-like metal-binding protein YciE